jgi:glycosyltransferase involved in cell wall biosynthesis
MRHCMVVQNYYPFDETRVQREAMALLEAGIEVDLVCMRLANEPKYEVVDGVHVHRLPLKKRRGVGPSVQLMQYLSFFLAALWKVTMLQRTRKYDSVQTHNTPDFLVFSALYPKLRGAKVILDIHDLMPEFFCSRFDTNMDHPLVRLLTLQEKMSCKFADHVITVTEPWREALIERKSVSRDRTSVVNNAADHRHFHRRSTPLSRGDGLDSSVKILYHGTIVHRYGVDMALRAVARLRQTLPKLEVAVHGRGDALEEVRELVKTLDLGDIVTLTSTFLPAEELADLVASADIGLVPYRKDLFTDGILPTKLLEYSVAGVAALASRTSAVTTYFGEGVVEMFEPDNLDDLCLHLERLIREPDRRASLASSIGRVDEANKWSEDAANYSSLVARLAGSRRRR